MKRLTLFRHAKSSWDDPDLDDFDRPLNERGRRAAPLMARRIAAFDPPVDIVLCSAAARTRETLALAGAVLARPAETLIRENLYLASPETMRDEIRNVSEQRRHVLMIAHNPGTEMLAEMIADPKTSDAKALKAMRKKYPTAGVAHFELATDRWTDIGRRSGALVSFLTPKNVAAEGREAG